MAQFTLRQTWTMLLRPLCALTLLGIAGCGKDDRSVACRPVIPRTEPTHISFTDVGRKLGLTHVLPPQPRPMRVLEAVGNGCGAFDADNDGWQDVLAIADPHPLLYRNVEGKFEDVTAASGLDKITADWMGCAVGDYDADGLLDVLVTGYQRLALYRNLGSMRFENVTEQAGLDPNNRGNWSTSAGFMDLDGDNRLDLVILNFIEFGPSAQQFCQLSPSVLSGCLPRQYVHQKGDIWRNTGGRFERVPPENGMASTSGVGLVVAFSDINRDGKMDIYIGNDGLPCEMLLNHGDMKFENIGEISGLAYDSRGNVVSSMGADWGDFDRNGHLDLAVSNFQESCFLIYRNHDQQQFADCAVGTGLADATRNRLGFGTKWLDFDNDGWVDVAFVNGHVYDNAAEVVGPHAQFRQTLNLFHNRQGEAFVDIAPKMNHAVRRPIVGRGSATLDFNNDGKMDLLAVDNEGPLMLLQNWTPGNRWLTLDLRGHAPNLFAYGARVTGRSGEQSWVGEVSPASSYFSSSDPRIHWGLGDVSLLDELTVHWPDGKVQTLRDVPANRLLTLRQEP